MPETPHDVLTLAEERGVQIVDLRFCDLPVLQQHFELILFRLVDQVAAGVVEQLAASLVVGQFGAGLVASSPC
jgi:hypothetical protein